MAVPVPGAVNASAEQAPPNFIIIFDDMATPMSAVLGRRYQTPNIDRSRRDDSPISCGFVRVHAVTRR
jgi:hypothetical protein